MEGSEIRRYNKSQLEKMVEDMYSMNFINKSIKYEYLNGIKRNPNELYSSYIFSSYRGTSNLTLDQESYHDIIVVKYKIMIQSIKCRLDVILEEENEIYETMHLGDSYFENHAKEHKINSLDKEKRKILKIIENHVI